MSINENKKEKNIDIDLLLFYLCISILSFSLYIIRHPLLSNFGNTENLNDLLVAYLPDLLIFMSIFVPYILIVISLLIVKMARKENISDNLYVILFFPLLSFFAKGMSLLQVYLYSDVIQIFKDNFAFFSFLAVGPMIVLLNKLLIAINNKLKLKKK
jgi:hypothetical protein